MSSRTKVAQMRQRRREQGFKETTIWLSKEADEVLADLVKSKGLKNRSEAVQFALSEISNRRSTMAT